MRADTVEEAQETYRRVLESLPTWGPAEPIGTDSQRRNHNETHREAASVSSGAKVCPPKHGKAREGKGGKLFCPTKLADGSWWRWRG